MASPGAVRPILDPVIEHTSTEVIEKAAFKVKYKNLAENCGSSSHGDKKDEKSNALIEVQNKQSYLEALIDQEYLIKNWYWEKKSFNIS